MKDGDQDVHITTQNHYVPRAYMRRWSAGTDHVWAYRTLVARATEPEWKLTPTARIARRRHLYTTTSEGRESDRVERWLNQEVETPGLRVLDRLIAGQTLSPGDRRTLARFVAALDRRGPVEYVESTARMAAELPGLMTGVLERVSRWATESVDSAGRLPHVDEPSDSLPAMKVFIRAAPTVNDPHRAEVGVDVAIGRELWLHALEHAVNHTSRALEEHDWAVVAPHRGWRWFTSDHPVIRLNFTSYDSYDFGGGWGSPGSEIMLPIGPHHLLYTQVGRSHRLSAFPLEQTTLVQRLVAERAYRWILGDGCPRRVAWFRPRRVDLDAYLEEHNAWQRWHEEQTKAHDPGRAVEVPGAADAA